MKSKLIPFCASVLFLLLVQACRHEQPTECDIKCSITPYDGTGETNGAGFFFDKKEKKCKKTRWTGSESLEPFQTLAECEACGCK